MIKERYSMSKAFNGTDRLQLFGLEIIALISQGKMETIEEIENHIDKCDLVQYIRDKYHDDMFNTFEDDCQYNLDDWNKAFSGYSGYIQGNERRKYGICNDNEGLLLVVALVLDMVSSK